MGRWVVFTPSPINPTPKTVTGPVKMWRSLIMGLVLPAGLTRTGPDCVSLPGFVGLSDKTTWCTRPGGLV
jgi:hypothetical protein